MAQITSTSGLLMPGYLTKVPNQRGSSHILCDLSNTSACSRPCATEPPPSQADVNLTYSLCGCYPREVESSRLDGLPSLTGPAPWSSWRKSLRAGHVPTYVDKRWKPRPMGGGSLLRSSLATPNHLSWCGLSGGSHPACRGRVPQEPQSEALNITPERGKQGFTCTYNPLYMYVTSDHPNTHPTVGGRIQLESLLPPKVSFRSCADEYGDDQGRVPMVSVDNNPNPRHLFDANRTCDCVRTCGCNPAFGEAAGLEGASFMMISPWTSVADLEAPPELPDRSPDDTIDPTVLLMLYQAPNAPGSATEVVNVAIGMNYNASLLQAATGPSYTGNPVWGQQGDETCGLVPTALAGTLQFLKMFGQKSDVGTKTEASSNNGKVLRGNTRQDLVDCLLARTSDYGGKWHTILNDDGLLICDRPGVGLTVMSEFDRLFLTTQDGSSAPQEHASGYVNFSVFLEIAKLMPRHLHRMSLEPMAFCFLVVNWLWARTTPSDHGPPSLMTRLTLSGQGSSLLSYLEEVLKDRKLYTPGIVKIGGTEHILSDRQLAQVREEARMLEYYLPYTFGSELGVMVVGEEGEMACHPTYTLPEDLRAAEWRMNDPTLCAPPLVSHHFHVGDSPKPSLLQVQGTPCFVPPPQQYSSGATPGIGLMGLQTPSPSMLEVEKLKAKIATMQEAMLATQQSQAGPPPMGISTALLTVPEHDLAALMTRTSWMEGYMALVSADKALRKSRYGPSVCGCGSFAPTTSGLPVMNGIAQVHAPGMFADMDLVQREKFWLPKHHAETMSQMEYQSDKIHYMRVIADYQTPAELRESGGEPILKVSLSCPQTLPCVECTKLLFASARNHTKLSMGDYKGDEEQEADFQVRRFFSQPTMDRLATDFGPIKAEDARLFPYHGSDMCPLQSKHWLLPTAGQPGCPIDAELWGVLKGMHPVETEPTIPKCLPLFIGGKIQAIRDVKQAQAKAAAKAKAKAALAQVKEEEEQYEGWEEEEDPSPIIPKRRKVQPGATPEGASGKGSGKGSGKSSSKPTGKTQLHRGKRQVKVSAVPLCHTDTPSCSSTSKDLQDPHQ